MLEDILTWQSNLMSAAHLSQKILKGLSTHCHLSLKAMDVVINPMEELSQQSLKLENARFISLHQGVLEFLQLCNQLLEGKKGLQKLEEFIQQIKAKNPALLKSLEEKILFLKHWVSETLGFSKTMSDLLKETLQTRGNILVEGLEKLAKDISHMQGFFTIPRDDEDFFSVGKNLATTPGKVIFRNELMELIQYKPKTANVWAEPILILPPWINKYYILDLTQQKSFVAWCLEHGYSVFIISWRNAHPKLAHKDFEDYVQEGPITALKVIQSITKCQSIHTLGYCIGGTLLATALAGLKSGLFGKIPLQVATATFLAAQIDFANAGILKSFISPQKISRLEAFMKECHGLLPGPVLTQTFNMLNAKELFWEPLVKKYWLRSTSKPFDLLYWNYDATNIPMNVHNSYLKNFYLHNSFGKGALPLFKTFLSPASITMPSYFVGTKHDHIVPWESVFESMKTLAGNTTFVLGGSGHVAGIINPPKAEKYQHWFVEGYEVKAKESPQKWLQYAQAAAGSWWQNWEGWLKKHSTGKKVKASTLQNPSFPPLGNAPGTYVLKKWFEVSRSQQQTSSNA